MTLDVTSFARKPAGIAAVAGGCAFAMSITMMIITPAGRTRSS